MRHERHAGGRRARTATAAAESPSPGARGATASRRTFCAATRAASSPVSAGFGPPCAALAAPRWSRARQRPTGGGSNACYAHGGRTRLASAAAGPESLGPGRGDVAGTRLRMPAVSRAASAPRLNLASRSCRSMATSRSKCCASASSFTQSVSNCDGPVHDASHADAMAQRNTQAGQTRRHSYGWSASECVTLGSPARQKRALSRAMAARNDSPAGWEASRADSRQIAGGAALRVRPRSSASPDVADVPSSGALESRWRAAMQEIQQELELERQARQEAELVLADTTQARRQCSGTLRPRLGARRRATCDQAPHLLAYHAALRAKCGAGKPAACA